MINEYIKKYSCYFVLMIIIIILFIVASYDSLNFKARDTLLFMGEKEIVIKDKYIAENNLYLSYEDIYELVESDIYIDKVSRKVILTTDYTIKKYELNSNISYTNFIKDEENEKNIYVKNNGTDYILLEEIASVYNKKVVINDYLNRIELVNENLVEANINSSIVYGYLKENSKNSRLLISNKNLVQVVKDDNLYDENSKYYTCVVEALNSTFVVYIPKIHIECEKVQENIEEQNDLTLFMNLVSNEDNLKVNSGNFMQIYGGLKISNKSGEVEDNLNYDIINETNESFVSLTNGYKSSNYDSNITTQFLHDDKARENLIQNVMNILVNNNIDGVVVNFRNFNSSCKEEFSQFIKELSTYANLNNKKALVYVPYNSSYIDLEKVLEYAHYTILIQYGNKNENSKVSGSHSSITWIESNLQNLKGSNVDLNKLIIEIPLYSIVWTEKNNVVVSAENIYLSAMEEFVTKNNLNAELDETTNQNYVQFTKGSLTYKVWLEDIYSVNEKIKLAKEYGLGGISLYKLGYDSEDTFSKTGG